MRFEALRETLLKAGIAPRHVRRYLRELDDHLADLTEAQHQAGYTGDDAATRARALLGDDTALAAAMLAQPSLKSWPARAPWLVFGLLPPLTILAAFFAAALLLVLVADVHGMMGHNNIAAPGWFRMAAQATALLANLTLGPALAALLVMAAWHQRLNAKWPLLASAIIAIVGVHMVAHFPQAGQRGGGIGIGTLIDTSQGLGPNWASEVPLLLAQFILTLLPAAWLCVARQRVMRGR